MKIQKPRKISILDESYLPKLEKYKFAVDQFLIAVITDKNGNIVDANDKFCEITKYQKDEIIGQTYKLINSHYHDKEFFQNLWTTISSGQTWKGFICNQTKLKELFWVETFITPILDAQGRIIEFLSLHNDVTPKVLLEKEVEQQRQKLFYSSKLISLGEMAGGLAHEINTPLTSLQIAARKLRREENLHSDSYQKTIQVIESTIERISGIVKGLQRISSHGEKEHLRNINLRQLISDNLNLCQEKLKSNHIILKIDFDSFTSLEAECRPSDISQVILSLINNAVDATLNSKEKNIELRVFEDASQFINICVKDSGIGIPKNNLTKLFQPFFTTKPVGNGMGLSLAISFSIMKDHGGEIFMNSTSPQTEFCLRWPKRQNQQKKEVSHG